MPLMVYATDPEWGAAAVRNHREVISALRRRDTAAVVAHTDWEFNDGARRLTERLAASGIWD
jgi:DNA-binding GntR family transcriptional regulator